MQSQKKKPKKQRNKYLTLTLIASQMGVTIYLGAQLGKFLDKKAGLLKPWFTIGCTFFSMVVSLYSIVKQLNRINNE